MYTNVTRYANPECNAEFLYWHKGELILLELPNGGMGLYWLCPACSIYLRLLYDFSEQEVRVVPKTELHVDRRLAEKEAA
jgi:hypothetical protein